MQIDAQQTFAFRTHGGARAGAGRPKKPGAGLPHARRTRVTRHVPHHVTVRVRRGTWNLRSQRSFVRFRAALAVVRRRCGFRVVQFSVQRDHVHLLVEANDRRAMSNGVRALLISFARRLNGMMSTRGSRFADRYHEHRLETPTEVRNALRYVFGNHVHHLTQRGAHPGDVLDAFSSAVAFLEVAPAESWLLRVGWRARAP